MSKIAGCLLVLFVFAFREGNGHSYSLGNCPIVEPLAGFNMDRLLGIWYVIQKSSTASYCLTYNFTKLDEPGHYLLEQNSQHFILGLTPLKHQYHYTGQLKVTNKAVPGEMSIKFPLNVLGSATFTVFMTDYDNYAGIFSCQSLGVGHRRSASILSRSRTLDKVFIDKIRTRLGSYNVDPFDLSIISQSDCPKPKPNETHGFDIDINPHTFSAENIAGVVRKAGEKVGDGIQYVAGGAKKAYHTLTENHAGPGETGGKISSDVEIIDTQTGLYRSPKSGQLRQSNGEATNDNWLP